MTYEDEARVLTKAFIRMIMILQLNRQYVSAIIGLCEASLSRLLSGQKNYLDPH